MWAGLAYFTDPREPDLPHRSGGESPQTGRSPSSLTAFSKGPSMKSSLAFTRPHTMTSSPILHCPSYALLTSIDDITSRVCFWALVA